MLNPQRPMDLAALALAALLAGLALLQWQSASSFSDAAEVAEARVVELRTAKKVILEAEADVFATVEFVPEGASESVRAELPTTVQNLGLEPEGLVGTLVSVRYDPAAPRVVRYGAASGAEGAIPLAALALFALFVPTIMRRSILASGGG